MFLKVSRSGIYIGVHDWLSFADKQGGDASSEVGGEATMSNLDGTTEESEYDGDVEDGEWS